MVALTVEALYVPVGQFEQVRSVLTVGAAFWNLPAPQLVTALHVVALAAVEKLTPSVHETHVRS